MKYKFLVAAALLSGAVATPGSAAPVTYLCEFQANTNTGWIPPQALYEIDQENGTATVYDAFVNLVHKKPIDVSMTEINSSKVRLKYPLVGIPVNGTGTAATTYKINLDLGKNKANMSVTLHGFDNQAWGKGSCARQK